MVSSLTLFSEFVDFRWLYYVSCLITPGIALVGDHRRDLYVRQMLERSHCSACLAIHYNVDVIRLRTIGELRSFQRGESPRQTLAIGLMAGNTVGSIHFLALGFEFLHRKYLAGVHSRCSRFLLLFRDPLGVFLRFHHFNNDGHEAVLLAAQFGALAAIGAGLVSGEPGVAHVTRYGILLGSQGRHPPGVNHVVGGEQYPHLLAYWYN